MKEPPGKNTCLNYTRNNGSQIPERNGSWLPAFCKLVTEQSFTTGATEGHRATLEGRWDLTHQKPELSECARCPPPFRGRGPRDAGWG